MDLTNCNKISCRLIAKAVGSFKLTLALSCFVLNNIFISPKPDDIAHVQFFVRHLILKPDIFYNEDGN